MLGESIIERVGKKFKKLVYNLIKMCYNIYRKERLKANL